MITFRSHTGDRDSGDGAGEGGAAQVNCSLEMTHVLASDSAHGEMLPLLRSFDRVVHVHSVHAFAPK